MTGALRDALVAAGALIALTLGCAGARADERPAAECTREDARVAAGAEGAGSTSAASESSAIAAEAAHTLPPVTVESQALQPAPHRAFWPVRFVDHFVDHFDLGAKLRALKRLKIVPVFDNARITVFLGVDRRGVAGLHIQQQDPNDLPPLLARDAPAELPFRAVPPRSP